VVPNTLPGETPYLAVDRDVLERNLARMAASAADRGMALRPHAKTHKCVEIARRQLAHGADGLTVATVGEAEIFAAAGCTDLFVAYPVWATEPLGRRLSRLAEQARVAVGVESVAGADQLGRTVAPGTLDVLVEIDSGHHRTGVDPGDAVTVAAAAERAGLRVAGVFTFPGHGYQAGARSAAAAQEAAALREAADALRAAGLPVEVVSGGSTPTSGLTGAGDLTELRPGVYVFNDAQQVELGVATWSEVALTVMATVVARHGDRVVLDAGSKALGADQAAWATGGGRLPDHPEARVTALSEHHATVVLPAGSGPVVGDVVRVAPNHVCATVNLADELTVVADGEQVDTWRVAARGLNR
jgi:D-serine deaminase-like pyridoxal phosphate-dependent protein